MIFPIYIILLSSHVFAVDNGIVYTGPTHLKISGYGEIDVLNNYGSSTNFNSDTIASAIQSISQNERAVLSLRPGNWKISGNLIIPTNISLKIQDGAILSINDVNEIIIDGSIIAGVYQIFSGTGKILFRQSGQVVYPNWWKNVNEKFYNVAIQKSLTSGAKSIYFPEGVYEIAVKPEENLKSINIPGNIRIYGQGKKSIIKLVEASKIEAWAVNDLFTGKDISDVVISHITFDGGKFYPDPETTSTKDPLIRGTRAISIFNSKNLTIRDCYFQNFTNGSLYLRNNDSVMVDRNTFFHHSYRFQTIRLDNSKNVTVSNNSFDDNGPHYYMVLGRSNEVASVDVIMVGYAVENANIVNNKITNAAAFGIRVENSKGVHVKDNIIDKVGEGGISFYRYTFDCSCSGNTISNWGKINNFGYIRKQNGKIYNPKEYHYPPPDNFPPLPQRLENAPTWELNRYYLQERDESTIPEYDPTDYETSFRAFRGFSAISVEDFSERIEIRNNIITGNVSKIHGLYTYASNYGISVNVTSSNPPVSGTGDCVIFSNTISGCIDKALYCPQYVDPIRKSGVAKPSKVFDNNCDPSKVLFYYTKD